MTEAQRQEMEHDLLAPSSDEELAAQRDGDAFREWVRIWGWPSAKHPYPGSDWAQL